VVLKRSEKIEKTHNFEMADRSIEKNENYHNFERGFQTFRKD
jgi:hypothetical protein